MINSMQGRSGGGQTHATTKMNVTIVVTIIIVNSNNRSSLQLDAYFKSYLITLVIIVAVHCVVIGVFLLGTFVVA